MSKLKLLQEFKNICDTHSIPFTFENFEKLIAHISK